ncbi:hypothetical protein CRG98_029321 [Punica granatum]|uniref:Uncharacterized protein n=1 Tax=Punica granatum TaxID=22663 RepID=A0A2I0J1Y6_PUNGR|nr:hypothetical protein CRG98_029321 [Punica granatum]
MGVLCLVVDLPTLPPPLLEAVKQVKLLSHGARPQLHRHTKLSCLLQDQLLSWWSDDSDAIATKVVVLTSSLPPAVDADLHKSLLLQYLTVSVLVRCHGIILNEAAASKTARMCCPITGHDLGCIDVVESSVKIGEKMSLFLPDSSKLINCQKVSTPIDFNVTERTNLGSLSEGVMVGAPHVVTPAAGHEIGETSDEMNELNAQLFQGVCRVLHSLDQGLVCYSKYNVEAKRSALFPCYYILQPSENGPMLLRRVAGLEETLPVLNMEKYFGSTVTKEIESSVQASILMVESIDYDPFLHPRGFHKNLNLLVEESIQFRPAPPPEEKVLTSDLNTSNANTIRSMDFVVDLTRGGEELEEEWEQLVVNEVPSVAAQAHAPTPATANQRGSKEAAASAADDKTWRILERLEAPGSNRFIHKNIDATATSNKLIRPNFQRLKRKLR